MGELRSIEGECLNQAQKIIVVNGFHTSSLCLGLRVVCPSSMPCCYAISLVFYCPTDTAAEPLSHPTLPTKTPVEEKMERLTTELQLMTRQRNELRERLTFITEGTVDNRYPSVQTSWECRQYHPLLLYFRVWGSTVKSDLNSRMFMGSEPTVREPPRDCPRPSACV